MHLIRLGGPLVVLFWLGSVAAAGDGNRLAYLGEFCDPYYVGLNTAKLTTPQWVGQEGVEAAIVLSIDDMKDPAPYEKFLRPIIERLKRIDGRAPISIMTTHTEPGQPHLQKWLKEGVHVEAHTYDHPCPCLKGGGLAKAKATYDRSIDILCGIPNGRPVAFRMPCCDSMNSVSPRFFVEIFNKTTPQGNFLAMDSSVFLLFTPDDPAQPRKVVFDEQGRLRFQKYVPVDRQFVNYVENYPYPYVIGRLCWEMPSAIPDDWLGINLQKPHNPLTVRDMKAAIDATARKQGVFTLTFHPARWIHDHQIIELIDHAVGRYGKRVKFLSFREVYDCLSKNVLGGHTLRTAKGEDNGVRLLDLDNDGYMDVVIGNEKARQTRLWSPKTGKWTSGELPVQIVSVDAQAERHEAGVLFGVLRKGGRASILVRNEKTAGVWHFDGGKWIADPAGLAGLELDGPLATSAGGRDRGVRLRDLDNDGISELVVSNPRQNAVFRWTPEQRKWLRLPLRLPEGTTIVDAAGRDAGLRFVDVNEDGHDDVVFSNHRHYCVNLFSSMAEGWSRKAASGRHGHSRGIPMIIRADGTNNGAWFKYRHMWLQNEDTGGKLPNHIDSRSFAEDLLSAGEKPSAR